MKKELKDLLSKRGKETAGTMTITELLNPRFINDSKGLTPKDKTILSVVNETIQEYVVESVIKEKQTITSTHTAFNVFSSILKNNEQEHLVALFLNTKNAVIDMKIMFIGTNNTSVAHPRDILREAIRLNSSRIIVGHSHPSGDATPSTADLLFTKRLARAAHLIGIELLDHIIIGCNGEKLSLQEDGFQFQPTDDDLRI